MGPPDIKKMLQVKIKPRKDPYTDQFSRILMPKMMMLTATITGISWAKDKFTCIVPKKHGVSKDFVAKSCWINGMYIYKDLNPNFNGLYYGIPKDISYDGRNNYGALCNSEKDANCEQMEKTFYLQYQWFPLGVAALAIMYYLPYLLFCVVNADLIFLKDEIKKKKKDEVDYENVIKKFFSHKKNPNGIARTMLNTVVKVLYVVANILGMIIIDSAINGEFMSFGQNWSKWLSRSPLQRNDYTIAREPKAGHSLLPGFGLCQLTSAGQDIKHNIVNKHTFVCEISQHVLYQYILIILWYVLIVGIGVSILGLLIHLITEFSSVFCIGFQGHDLTRLYSTLTTREKQLLDFVRKKNMPVFGELLDRLMQIKGIKRGDDYDNPRYPTDYDRAQEKERMMAESY